MGNAELPEKVWISRRAFYHIEPPSYCKEDDGAYYVRVRADLVSSPGAAPNVLKALDDVLQCFRNGATPHRDIIDAAEQALATARSAPAPASDGAPDDQPQHHAKYCDRWVQCGDHEHYKPIISCTCTVSEDGAVAAARELLRLIHHRYVLTFRKEEIKGCPICYPQGHFTKEPPTLREDVAAIISRYCFTAPAEVINELDRHADAVVGAAVAWHESGQEGDGGWFEASERLTRAIDSLLAIRSASDMPRRWCSVHKREEFKYESLEHELHAATTSAVPSAPSDDVGHPRINGWPCVCLECVSKRAARVAVPSAEPVCPCEAGDPKACTVHVYCHGCSEAGGADRPIYHKPPVCPVPSAGLEEPCPTCGDPLTTFVLQECNSEDCVTAGTQYNCAVARATPSHEPQQCVTSTDLVHRKDAIRVIQDARERGHADLRELIAELRSLPVATPASETLRCVKCPHDPKWRDERGCCQYNTNPDKLPCNCKCVFSTGAPADDADDDNEWERQSTLNAVAYEFLQLFKTTTKDGKPRDEVQLLFDAAREIVKRTYPVLAELSSPPGDAEKQARELLRDLQRRGFLDDDIFENPNFDDSFVVSLVTEALRYSSTGNKS